MTANQPPDDVLARVLGRLETREPDPARAALGRARCHAALARPSWRARVRRLTRASAASALRWRTVLEPAVVGLLCAVYLSAVLRRALVLYGWMG